MLTYLGINLIFVFMALLLSWGERGKYLTKPRLIAALILLLLTLVFDNLIIANGIVAYEDSKLSGLYLGLAPIEDFMYPLTGLLLLPYVWKKVHERS